MKLETVLNNTSFYQTQLERYQLQLQAANKRLIFLGTARLTVFVSTALGLYFTFGNPILFGAIGLVGIVAFLILVAKTTDARVLKLTFQKLVEINTKELMVLQGDWSPFPDGSSYKNGQHPFSSDMDLFGQQSIFQLINRTVSKKGEKLLVNNLLNGVSDVETVNEAIAEFSTKMEWCQQFLAAGMVQYADSEEKTITKLKEIEAANIQVAKWGQWLLPILFTSAVVLYALNIISGQYFGIFVVLELSFIGLNFKKTSALCDRVADYEKTIALYANRIEQYQQLQISSPKMLELREKNFGSKSDLIMSLRELEKIQKRMSYRMNLLVGTILNMCVAWDFRVICQWEEWRQKYQSQLPEVEEHLTEMEVWISGAIYHYNFPETTFAHFNQTDEVDIIGLGHPFIPSSKRVLNDVKYAENEQFYIITGPNMAGKSTFLRSIGWALISANAGFPIMAKTCSMPRMKLYTSMRNTDDLKEESSYFYAELVRLRFIVDAIESGEKIFIILDEILKGTNSKDKELGSAGLMRKLANLHARGIIATHDLSLCNLANENKSFSNYYFDSTIDKDELHFDYLLRQGTCKNMNASFLLQKMRLVD
jgi:hypothetical protein